MQEGGTMESYKFGGSKIKKISSTAISCISKCLCKIKFIFIWVAKKVNRVSIAMKHKAEHIRSLSEPITIHITRIVPLDKWSTRIEFTVNRKDKKCLHIYSDSGDYSDIFAEYKRGGKVEPTEAFYFMVSGLINNWKQM